MVAGLSHPEVRVPRSDARNAKAIFLQAGLSQAMPPANVTYITSEERRILVAWGRAAQ